MSARGQRRETGRVRAWDLALIVGPAASQVLNEYRPSGVIGTAVARDHLQRKGFGTVHA